MGKITQNPCTVVKNQGFARLKKTRFLDRFSFPRGSLWAYFCSLWASLGLSLGSPEIEKAGQSCPTEEYNGALDLAGHPSVSKAYPGPPKSTQMVPLGLHFDEK